MKTANREKTSGTSGAAPFGHVLRAKRLGKKLGLRRFAELAGISPTYLCRVEQCSVMPPTVDRVRRMAELLEEDPDQWVALAGRAPDDLSATIAEAPVEVLQIVRAMRGMTPRQLQKLRDAVDRITQGS
ncbi:MAG TPA: helix-turn-helix transcriptional regulator [Pirellulales bacterium]|nr:helix-turn-helix transcriptional regulator [Pirellulales bacterium]